MSIDLSSDLVAYHSFIEATLANGGSIDEDATPAAFLQYQEQLSRLRAALQPAADRFHRGESASELDVDHLVDEVLNDGANSDDRS